ncbi:hypothetical protein BDV30DRAFT_238882 [Aspergillus minisclerotigenes]|uniref:Heterokaryon incompatibility protein-domain-containing protein n=1 Tax=Aspergillus minisclerotigenes TaxID=656917 RepID=A0A5N6J2Y6_9EURO|nr:hypothetical protein BDV30DRAFT_238882 [Aspergillus minisclerotigenes]
MRLLRTNAVPLELKEFGEDKINKREIKYAILSHRWGDDETSFQDLARLEETGLKVSKGYKKIQRFLERAAKDGYEYAWIDTCCINKESSAELSEAINSMFRWYQLADICYAYLQDVYPSESPASINTQLQNSEWFQRGWTLQELIAPPNLVFLSNDWSDVGDKNDLSQLISKITLIDEDILRGKTRLGDCSVAKRMSWASTRVTTRTEDTAYCLMGIFNVNMPLLYGEGRKAFVRLQEEIMKDSDDQSIFAWDASDFQGFQYHRPVSTNTRLFQELQEYRSFPVSQEYHAAMEMGFEGELVTEIKALLLECQEVSADQSAKPVAVLLGQLPVGDSQFIRIDYSLYGRLAWGYLLFIEPSEIYARKIYQGFEEAIIEPSRKPIYLFTTPQRNMILFFDDGYYNAFSKENGSAIQAIHDLVSDAGNFQVCYFEQSTADDNIEKRVMRAYEWCVDNYDRRSKWYIFGFSSGGFVAQILAQILETIGMYPSGLHAKRDIWNSYQAWYRAVSLGNPDSASGELSEMSLIRSQNFKCTVTFLGLFDSVNMTPGCNLARGVSGCRKEEKLPSVVTHPGLVVRHAVAIDERQPALQPNLGHEAAKYMHNFEELWFPGGHADIGGVAQHDTNEKWKLGHIPLVWMIREATRAGLSINPYKLRQYFDLGELKQAQAPGIYADILEDIFSSDEMKDGLSHAAKVCNSNDYWEFSDQSTPRSILRTSVLEDIPPFDISKKMFSARAVILKEQLFEDRLWGRKWNRFRHRRSIEIKIGPQHFGLDWVDEFLYFQMRRPVPDIRRFIPNGAAYHTSVIHRMCSKDKKYRPANKIDVGVKEFHSVLHGALQRKRQAVMDSEDNAYRRVEKLGGRIRVIHPFLNKYWRIKRQADFIGESRILGEVPDECLRVSSLEQTSSV